MRIILAILGAAALMWTGPATAQEKQLYMMDFVFMSNGHDLGDRDRHNQKARPIAARHGVELKASFDAKVIFAGPKELDRLDFWTLPHPSALQAWGADPEYKKIEPNARKIHDFNQLTLYLGRERGVSPIIHGKAYYIELFTFDRQSFSVADFADYLKKSQILAREYGLLPVARFNKMSKILGKGPKANWLNIYSVQSVKALKPWSRDERFRALIPLRNKLMLPDKLVMGLFKAR